MPLELAPGRHEIELKLTTYDRTPSATVALAWPGRLGTGYRPDRGVAIPEPQTPMELLVVAHTLQGRGDAVHAVAMIGLDDGGPEASSAMLVHRAGLIGDEPYLPDDRKEQLAAQLMRHAHERDPEADAALVVQISHETNSSRSYREISGAEGMMATTGTFPAEWIDFWRLPALTVLYEYTERPTRYIIHRVYYDGDALSALHIMRAVTSLT